MGKASYNRRSKAMRQLALLREQKHRMNLDIRKAAHAAYPIGSQFAYQHGQHVRIATVVGHNDYNESLLVEGVSGTRYWIEVWRAFQ